MRRWDLSKVGDALILKGGAGGQQIRIVHDKSCPLLKGGECDCEPDIKLVEPEK